MDGSTGDEWMEGSTDEDRLVDGNEEVTDCRLFDGSELKRRFGNFETRIDRDLFKMCLTFQCSRGRTGEEQELINGCP
jgi:hypothetical protein